MNSYKLDIPIFPLDNVIMLPGSILPLNIFEKRYLNMFDDALKTSSRLIGIIQPLMNKKENIESFNNVYYAVISKYRGTSIKRSSSRQLLANLNFLKIGVLYGLIVDAFKLGS